MHESIWVSSLLRIIVKITFLKFLGNYDLTPFLLRTTTTCQKENLFAKFKNVTGMWPICLQGKLFQGLSAYKLPCTVVVTFSTLLHGYIFFFADIWSDPEKKNSLQEKVCNSASAFMQYACMAIPQKSLCNKTAPPVLFMGITSHLKKRSSTPQ